LLTHPKNCPSNQAHAANKRNQARQKGGTWLENKKPAVPKLGEWAQGTRNRLDHVANPMPSEG